MTNVIGLVQKLLVQSITPSKYIYTVSCTRNYGVIESIAPGLTVVTQFPNNKAVDLAVFREQHTGSE